MSPKDDNYREAGSHHPHPSAEINAIDHCQLRVHFHHQACVQIALSFPALEAHMVHVNLLKAKWIRVGVQNLVFLVQLIKFKYVYSLWLYRTCGSIIEFPRPSELQVCVKFVPCVRGICLMYNTVN